MEKMRPHLIAQHWLALIDEAIAWAPKNKIQEYINHFWQAFSAMSNSGIYGQAKFLRNKFNASVIKQLYDEGYLDLLTDNKFSIHTNNALWAISKPNSKSGKRRKLNLRMRRK